MRVCGGSYAPYGVMTENAAFRHCPGRQSPISNRATPKPVIPLRSSTPRIGSPAGPRVRQSMRILGSNSFLCRLDLKQGDGKRHEAVLESAPTQNQLLGLRRNAMRIVRRVHRLRIRHRICVANDKGCCSVNRSQAWREAEAYFPQIGSRIDGVDAQRFAIRA